MIYLESVGLRDTRELEPYLRQLPLIRLWRDITFHNPVTFLVGENGAGKSTLLEAIAVACGFSAEGGSRSNCFSTADTHSGLYRAIKLARGAERPADGYFLRAESFYNVATELERVAKNGLGAGPDDFFKRNYGGKSLHGQSHGESFLSLLINRFHGEGLYLLDEPEAALSPTRQLALLVRMHELVKARSQLVIATHSPILMAYPEAEIYTLDETGVYLTPYEETEHYFITKRFLENPQRMLQTLFRKEER